MKTSLIGFALFLLSQVAFAQGRNFTAVSDSASKAIIAKAQKRYPKFYLAWREAKTNDKLIRSFKFIDTAGVGPAFASPKGEITLNLNYIERPKPAFDDNRLIVVLYHEIGHLHYYETTERSKWNPEDSEKAAFEYSLLKTKQLAENGDCLPLLSGLKFMKIRSESNELKDPHVRALKKIVNETFYLSYLKYADEHCKNQTGVKEIN